MARLVSVCAAFEPDDLDMSLGRHSATEKIAWFLIQLRTRWSRTPTTPATVPIPMSRRDIADYLGMTIETISHSLSKFADDRLIVILPHEVRFTDDRKMQRLAPV